MKTFKLFLVKAIVLGGLIATWGLSGVTQAAALPPSAPVDNFSAVVENCTKSTFFGLRPWYYYLGKELDSGSVDSNGNKRACDVKCFNFIEGSKPNECGQTKSDVPLVLLVVIDDLLRIAGIMAVCFVLWGAVRYTTSQGNPEQTSKAQQTIINAVAGLALAGVSIAFVSYLGNKLGG